MRYILLLILTATIFQSCYRNDITFGELPPGNYTDVVSIDTVEARLSTLVTDSFITSGATSFLVGKYKDPYLGVISTKPFFRMTVPSGTVSIPSSAQYDSACFIIRLNKYYYGD